MANVFSLDREQVTETLSALCDALDDLGYNIPRERLQDPQSPMRRFLANMENMEAADVWKTLDDSLKGMAKDLQGDQTALKYVQMAYEELKESIRLSE